MLNLVKPGHVLRFTTDPGTIFSPHGAKDTDYQLTKQWPVGQNTLGNVTLISHPAGDLGKVASLVATGMREGSSASRSLSYSKLGNFIREKQDNQNVILGAVVADFVGYNDGFTNYTASNNTVFSKDFSGCLMVVYTDNGQRRVAHVAASQVGSMDCKQVFLTQLNGDPNSNLIGWFRPYVQDRDLDGKLRAYNQVKKYCSQIDKLITFGVVTTNNQGYSFTAFKPTGITLTNNDYVVTNIRQFPMSQSHVFVP